MSSLKQCGIRQSLGLPVSICQIQEGSMSITEVGSATLKNVLESALDDNQAAGVLLGKLEMTLFELRRECGQGELKVLFFISHPVKLVYHEHAVHRTGTLPITVPHRAHPSLLTRTTRHTSQRLGLPCLPILGRDRFCSSLGNVDPQLRLLAGLVVVGSTAYTC